MLGSRFLSKKALAEAVEKLEKQGERDKGAYASLLRQCGEAKALAEGKRLHSLILRAAYEQDTFLSNLLVQMYGQCASIVEARRVFHQIREPNVFSCTIMIAAYAHNGHLENARNVFDSMPSRDVVAWNAMIASYAQKGRGKEALGIFRAMNLEGMSSNERTFLSVLDACADHPNPRDAKLVHATVVESGLESEVKVGNGIITMYGKCGILHVSRRMFQGMPMRDVVSWNAMIGAYTQNGYGNEALVTFRLMCLEGMVPDDVTFITVLEACSLAEGKKIHAYIMEHGFDLDLVTCTALIHMYGRCRSPQDAKDVFDRLQLRDVVLWTSMISAYVKNGYGELALELFQLMDLEGVNPNEVTFSNILDACASLQALRMGRIIHVCAKDSGLLWNLVVTTAILDMYAKCGELEAARNVFENIPHKNVVCCNAMIAAYAQNGHDLEALNMFRRIELEGVTPDEATFVSILTACSHAGLLDDACQFFVSLMRDYSLRPTMDHHVCIIDILGRAGLLDEAELLITCVPFQGDLLPWLTLLGACRMHADVDRGTRAAEHVSKLDAADAAPYVLLSSIHAAVGNVDEAATRLSAATPWGPVVKAPIASPKPPQQA